MQEVRHDTTKTECCNEVKDSWSFLKRLPIAASFVLVLTTLVSLTKAYFGRELVLIRKGKSQNSKLLYDNCKCGMGI